MHHHCPLLPDAPNCIHAEAALARSMLTGPLVVPLARHRKGAPCLRTASRVLCRTAFSAARSRAASRSSGLRLRCCRILRSSSAVPAHAQPRQPSKQLHIPVLAAMRGEQASRFPRAESQFEAEAGIRQWQGPGSRSVAKHSTIIHHAAIGIGNLHVPQCCIPRLGAIASYVVARLNRRSGGRGTRPAAAAAPRTRSAGSAPRPLSGSPARMQHTSAPAASQVMQRRPLGDFLTCLPQTQMKGY